MSLPPLYDDVSYLVDGAKWLNAADEPNPIENAVAVMMDAIIQRSRSSADVQVEIKALHSSNSCAGTQAEAIR